MQHKLSSKLIINALLASLIATSSANAKFFIGASINAQQNSYTKDDLPTGQSNKLARYFETSKRINWGKDELNQILKNISDEKKALLNNSTYGKVYITNKIIETGTKLVSINATNFIEEKFGIKSTPEFQKNKDKHTFGMMLAIIESREKQCTIGCDPADASEQEMHESNQFLKDPQNQKNWNTPEYLAKFKKYNQHLLNDKLEFDELFVNNIVEYQAMFKYFIDNNLLEMDGNNVKYLTPPTSEEETNITMSNFNLVVSTLFQENVIGRPETKEYNKLLYLLYSEEGLLDLKKIKEEYLKTNRPSNISDFAIIMEAINLSKDVKAKLEKDLKDSQGKLTTAENEKNTLDTKIKQLQDDIKSSKDNAGKLAKEVEKDYIELEKAKKDIEDFKGQIASKDNEIGKLNTEKAQIQKDLDDNKLLLGGFDKALEILGTENQTLQGKLATAENEKNTLDAKIKQLQDDINLSKDTSGELAKELAKDYIELEKAKKDIEDFKGQIASKDNEIGKLNTEKAQIQKDLDDNKLLLGGFDKALEILGTENQTLQGKLATAENDKKDLNDKIKQLEDDIKSSKDTSGELAKELANLKGKINKAEQDIKNLNDKIALLNKLVENKEPIKELTAEQIKQEEIKELASIKGSASRTELSASLMSGYRLDYTDFALMTELGLDLSNSKVGKNADKELEVKNKFHLYLAQKVGYKLTKNHLTYATFGFGLKDYQVSYRGQYAKIDESKIVPSFIIGAGYEYKINKNLSAFTEFNHIISLVEINTKAGNVQTKSEQMRIGARWYF